MIRYKTIFWIIVYIIFFTVDVIGADISEFVAQVPFINWFSDIITAMSLQDILQVLILVIKLIDHIVKLIKSMRQ